MRAWEENSMKRCVRDLITTLGLSILIIAAASVSAAAQKKYDTGATDTEIKIGNIMPYSGRRPLMASSARP
jgi:hypothetical protein